jgi:nitrate reductase gamma subunit
MFELLEFLCFIILPYITVVVCVSFTLHRYFTNPFSFSSLSSQFLENKKLFLGSILWHVGIIVVLLGHLVAFLVPNQVKIFNSVPLRLYFFEGAGLILGLSALVGFILLCQRRLVLRRIKVVTSKMDFIVILILLFQLITGVYIAVFLRWGSSWSLITAVPYIRSLFILQPKMNLIVDLPLIFKLHMINAFIIVGIFPFTRLVHLLSLPFAYLYRPYQIVIWNIKKRKINLKYN